ncbi:hypothetical protein D1AOALGA4SA_2905 [Olavius algarvensis Delta 1 endosymbiont]|nr:hypothetical protein D1AOALGA4SA_2905 [Olavius algarvensis Delta 1 endosymbiont]
MLQHFVGSFFLAGNQKKQEKEIPSGVDNLRPRQVVESGLDFLQIANK